jgi:cobalamin biosynthesis protein CobD/CbiB
MRDQIRKDGNTMSGTLVLFGRDRDYSDAVAILRAALETADETGRDLLHGAICHLLAQWGTHQGYLYRMSMGRTA